MVFLSGCNEANGKKVDCKKCPCNNGKWVIFESCANKEHFYLLCADAYNEIDSLSKLVYAGLPEWCKK